MGRAREIHLVLSPNGPVEAYVGKREADKVAAGVPGWQSQPLALKDAIVQCTETKPLPVKTPVPVGNVGKLHCQLAAGHMVEHEFGQPHA